MSPNRRQLMNGKRIGILIIALAVSALILWHDLPIEFPWIIGKVVILFLKLFVVFVLAVFAFVFVDAKKKTSPANGLRCPNDD